MVEERQRLHEKTCNSYLNSDATSEHAMSDHSKQLRPCLYVAQNYQFQFEIVFLGENGMLLTFYLSFSSRKNKPVTSKKQTN